MKMFRDAPFQYREAFHSLRTNINFILANKDIKRIIVTSSVPGEGKTSIAVNLSLALSEAKQRVMLVDADLRRPCVHKVFNIPGGTRKGLANILQSADDSVKDYIHSRVDNKGLSVMPCGTVPPNPTVVLGSNQMSAMLEQLGGISDYVIIDTPPVSVVTDAAVLSQFADGVILVVRQKAVTFEQARQAKRNLEAVNANILGVVFNDFNMKHTDKSGAYYHDYY